MINGLPSTGYPASDLAQKDQAAMRRQSQFECRRDSAERTRLVQSGQHTRYVENSLRAAYHPDTFAAMHARLRTSNNPLKDIVRDAVVEWSNGATYKLTQAATDGTVSEYDDANGAFAQMLAVGQFDSLARGLAELRFLHPRVAVGPTVCMQERTGKRQFSWAIHTPETFTVEECSDCPGDYESLTTYGTMVDAAGVERECKTEWESDEVEVYILRSGRWEKVSEQPNPYRTIPFVLVPYSTSSGGVWLPSWGDMLSEVAIEVACWETFLSYVGAGQVKVLTGEFKGFPQGQVLRHAGVLSMGDAENINIQDFQTDVLRMRECYINEPIRQARVAVGLRPDAEAAAGAPESGEAKRMRNYDRDRQAMLRLPALKQSIEQLFWMMRHVLEYQLNATGEDGKALPPIAGIDSLIPWDAENFNTQGLQLRIDVNEINYPETAAERAAVEDRDLELGLTNPVELYKQRNPDVTDEEARAMVLRNRAITASLGNTQTMSNPATVRRLLNPSGGTGTVP